MVGEARIVFGGLLLAAGGVAVANFAVLVSLVEGAVALGLGIALLAWGFKARQDAERSIRQQAHVVLLHQQQANPARPLPVLRNSPLDSSSLPSLRSCSSCGAEVPRTASFCHLCGGSLTPLG